ncbi:MAG TPA: 16S rRNA (guanine(527)-N(7))-methyltransferase RsmG [Chitinophagaceae bacterium]|nr:16S rRNA (guanine(527)-N(7))-methyltransferase RsmG [Chitinophagaceae bacterium]
MEIILKYFSDFTSRQIQQFESLKDLYKDWNEKINVISRKDIDSLYERHVLHSLSIAAAFEFQPGNEIIDLGTGGGFPGIPLAIFFPEVKFHLVDSIAKKLKVVEAVAENIGLTNVTIQHSRIEDIKNRKFDFVVSRAVAPLKDLWRWSKPLLRSQRSEVGSQKKTDDSGLPTPDSRLPTHPGLICLKGGDLAIEIQESNTRPRLMEIKEIFEEAFFKDKFILYVPR